MVEYANNNKINSTGSYGETGYTGIVFWISLCMNNSFKNDCYPLEVSKKILDKEESFKSKAEPTKMCDDAYKKYDNGLIRLANLRK